jgi:hypothetical protein
MIDRGRPDPFLMNDNRPASWTPGGFNFDAGVRSLPTFGIEGHEQLIDLTRLWFRSPHFGLAAETMRTSEPPY